MSRLSRFPCLVMAAVAIVAAPIGLGAQRPVVGEPPFAGVSLKVGDETVEPGGMAQVKVFVTEPRPISTAGGRFTFDGMDSFDGIAILSPARDAFGVVVVRGAQLTVSVLSPSATFGMDSDYPVLTVTGHVASTLPIGTRIPLDVDLASLQFRDASGIVYPTDAGPGELVIGRNVEVDDVVPGSANVNAGDVVTIVGRRFQPTTRVKFKEIALSGVQFVDSSHLLATLAQPTRMHGQGIRIVNRDGAETKYFSYQRTRRQGTSAQPTLRDAVPVFADRDVTGAFVDVGGVSTGLALQNRQPVASLIAAELLDASGRVCATAWVRVRPGQFILTELSELFGMAYSSSQVVRVRSDAPIQVMGVAVDAAGNASPIAAR